MRFTECRQEFDPKLRKLLVDLRGERRNVAAQMLAHRQKQRQHANRVDPALGQCTNALAELGVGYFEIGEGDRDVRAQTVISLAEMSQRLNMTCLFDEKTRKITDGSGKEVKAITYGTLELS